MSLVENYHAIFAREQIRRQQYSLPLGDPTRPDTTNTLWQLANVTKTEFAKVTQPSKEEAIQQRYLLPLKMNVNYCRGGDITKMVWPEAFRSNLCIAGGSALSRYRGVMGNDIDVFIVHNHEATLKAILSLVGDSEVMWGPEVVTIPKLWLGGNKFYNVQIILRAYNSVSEVITGFDVDCCCIVYYLGEYYVTERGWNALATGRNFVNPILSSTSYGHRLLKYARRGFGVQLPLATPEKALVRAYNKKDPLLRMRYANNAGWLVWAYRRMMNTKKHEVIGKVSDYRHKNEKLEMGHLRDHKLYVAHVNSRVTLIVFEYVEDWYKAYDGSVQRLFVNDKWESVARPQYIKETGEVVMKLEEVSKGYEAVTQDWSLFAPGRPIFRYHNPGGQNGSWSFHPSQTNVDAWIETRCTRVVRFKENYDDEDEVALVKEVTVDVDDPVLSVYKIFLRQEPVKQLPARIPEETPTGSFLELQKEICRMEEEARERLRAEEVREKLTVGDIRQEIEKSILAQSDAEVLKEMVEAQARESQALQKEMEERTREVREMAERTLEENTRTWYTLPRDCSESRAEEKEREELQKRIALLKVRVLERILDLREAQLNDILAYLDGITG